MAASWTSRRSFGKSAPKTLPSFKYGTATEARLSLMGTAARRPHACFGAEMDWERRFKTDPATWTVEALTERRERLLQDLLALRELVETPPPEWEGPYWMAMWERAERWAGQLIAIDRALRKWREKPSSPPSSANASETPDPLSTSCAAGSGMEEPYDPFINE